MNKAYFRRTIFSQTDIKEIVNIQQKYLQSTEMCFNGFPETVWFLMEIPLILYQFFIMLPTSDATYWKNLTYQVDSVTSYHLKIQSLGLSYWNVYHLRITFFNHKPGYHHTLYRKNPVNKSPVYKIPSKICPQI